MALVDESSTLGAVDYPRMLSELGKYGASFVLVTQSLAKLDAIDRNLAPTILSNTDGLTVFQVSAEDARRLRAGARRATLEIEDLVSTRRLQVLRAVVGRTAGARPVFTLRVDRAAARGPDHGAGVRGALGRALRPAASRGRRAEIDAALRERVSTRTGTRTAAASKGPRPDQSQPSRGGRPAGTGDSHRTAGDADWTSATPPMRGNGATP